MKILHKIILEYYCSGGSGIPLTFFIYKDDNTSFSLRSNKPKDDFELVDFFDFDKYLKQDANIVQRFYTNHFCKYVNDD